MPGSFEKSYEDARVEPRTSRSKADAAQSKTIAPPTPRERSKRNKRQEVKWTMNWYFAVTFFLGDHPLQQVRRDSERLRLHRVRRQGLGRDGHGPRWVALQRQADQGGQPYSVFGFFRIFSCLNCGRELCHRLSECLIIPVSMACSKGIFHGDQA